MHDGSDFTWKIWSALKNNIQIWLRSFTRVTLLSASRQKNSEVWLSSKPTSRKNAVIKGDWGAIELTEDLVALRRWMVACLEVSYLVAVYETVPVLKDNKNNSRNHEQTMCAQKSFHKKVKSFSDVVREMGNPFQEESADLLVLDSNNAADPSFVSTIDTLHQLRKYQFLSFTEML